MPSPTKVAFASGSNGGGATLTPTNPTGATTGDRIQVMVVQTNNNVSITNLQGWTLVKDETFNTRRVFVLERAYASSYTAMTLSGSVGMLWASWAVRPTSGYTLGATVLGTTWLRVNNGGSINTTQAPSISAAANSLSLALFAETSTATEIEAGATLSGSGWSKYFWAKPSATAADPVLFVASEDISTAAASGTATVTYLDTSSAAVNSNNGWGVQLSIPQTASNVAPTAAFTHSETGLQTTVDGTGSNDTDGTIAAYDWDWGDGTTHGTTGTMSHTYASAGTYTVLLTVTDNLGATGSVSHSVTVASSPPTSGQVGIRACLNFGQTYLTIAFDKIGGTVLECVLYASNGTTELTRQTMTNDGTTGWGNCNFSGLTANTTYVVKAEVDSTAQTDVLMTLKTLKASGSAQSFTFVAGSCNFTSSNHPIWDNIRTLAPEFVDHMGDDGYMDATTESAWRAGVESTMTTSKRIAFHSVVPMAHNYDNHDRIITNPTGAGTGLNNGETDAATNTEYRQLAGTTGWSSSDTLGRSWQVGRVLFIATDHWSVRDDADGDPSPRTMMGATQKAWFKALLTAAASDNTVACIVWFCQWTAQNDANGRWNSYTEETADLEAHINALAGNGKRKIIMLGGDSHILQADSGLRTLAQGSRFVGVPSLNISGFNRSSYPYSTGNWNIAESELRGSGSTEADWGGYGKCTITDNGAFLLFRWDAIRVNASGTEDTMAHFEKSFGQPGVADEYVGTTRVPAKYIGLTQVWKGENW